MPLDRLVLILVCVLAAAGVTVWIGTLVATAVAAPLAWLALVPVALAALLLWRVVADRLGDPEDDRYDRME